MDSTFIFIPQKDECYGTWQIAPRAETAALY